MSPGPLDGPTSRRPPPDDRGAVAGAEVLPLCVLVLVVGTLVVANAWAVVDARLAADVAAQAAVRAYVEAPDAPSAAAGARAAAHQVMAGWGRDTTPTDVVIDHPDGRGFVRCAAVVVRVRHEVPRAALPLIGVVAGSTTVEGRQSEVIDPFRGGLPGEASC